MFRLLTLVALLLCLLGQSFTAAHATAQAHGVAGWQHASLHEQETLHHHHGDSVQLDGADESDVHEMGDHVCCPAALPPSDLRLSTLPTVDGLVSSTQAQVPAPAPDRLLRPPRP